MATYVTLHTLEDIADGLRQLGYPAAAEFVEMTHQKFLTTTPAQLSTSEDALRERDALRRELKDIEAVLHEVEPEPLLGDTLARAVVEAFTHERHEKETVADAGKAHATWARQKRADLERELASANARFCEQHRGEYKTSGCVVCGLMTAGTELQSLGRMVESLEQELASVRNLHEVCFMQPLLSREYPPLDPPALRGEDGQDLGLDSQRAMEWLVKRSLDADRYEHALTDCEIHKGVEGIAKRTACALCFTEALQDSEDETRLRERLTTILTTTANALKGPPAPLHLHSWHDLAAWAESQRSALLHVVEECNRNSDWLKAERRGGEYMGAFYYSIKDRSVAALNGPEAAK